MYKQTSQHDGKKGQNPSSQTPLRGMSQYLPLQTESFADHLRSLIQHFGQVAAAFALDQNGRRNDLHVLQRNTR